MPLGLIRFRPTQNAMDSLRSLITTADLLKGCNLQTALQGNVFDEKACGKHQKSTNNDDMEIRILQPTESINEHKIVYRLTDIR